MNMSLTSNTLVLICCSKLLTAAGSCKITTSHKDRRKKCLFEHTKLELVLVLIYEARLIPPRESDNQRE
jgi:hypothetical protein